MKKILYWFMFLFLSINLSSAAFSAESETKKTHHKTHTEQNENVTPNSVIVGGDSNGQVSSDIGQHTVLIGNKVNLSQETSFEKPTLIIGNSTTLEGNYNNDVMVIGSDVTINAHIKGDLRLIGSDVDIKPGTKISGDLYYLASDFQIEKGAMISGKVTPWQTQEFFVKQQPWYLLTAGLLLYIGLFILGLLLILIVPNLSKKTVTKFIKKPWASLGWGLLTLVLTPIVMTLFLVTVIGIPIAFVLFFLYVAALMLAYVYIAMSLGILIFKLFRNKSDSKWLYACGVLFGLIILFLITKIPYVGSWLGFIALLLGLGSLMMGVFQKSDEAVIKSE